MLNSESPADARPAGTLSEVLRYFLRQGFLGFGGPLALIALFQRELVEERQWISFERFARAIALIKALPGPVSSQLAIYLGRARAGTLGGIVAGLALITPAFFMMIALAAFYTSIESLSWTRPILFGMQAAALGVIADGIWRLARPYKTRGLFWVLALLACAFTCLKPSIEPLVILGFGIAGVFLPKIFSRGSRTVLTALCIAIATAVLATQFVFFDAHAVTNAAPVTHDWLASAPRPIQLIYIFVKAGAFTFGTGLAIIPMLASDVVERFHWLTPHQFMDALAFGQITPGPVIITSTFVGYRVLGFGGAILATTAVFAAAFFNILTWFPIAERKLAGREGTARFVMWAIAAVTGTLVFALARLAASPLPAGGPQSRALFLAIAAAAFFAATRTRAPVWAVIPAGGLLAALLAQLM